MKILFVVIVSIAVLFGIIINVKTMLECNGAVVQGAYKYECIER